MQEEIVGELEIVEERDAELAEDSRRKRRATVQKGAGPEESGSLKSGLSVPLRLSPLCPLRSNSF